MRALAQRSQPLLEALDSALAAWQPMTAVPSGQTAVAHKEMDSIAKTLRAVARLNLAAVKKDLQPAPVPESLDA